MLESFGVWDPSREVLELLATLVSTNRVVNYAP